MTVDRKFSVGNVTRFFVPLLIQSFSQCLTYPLVAGIVTHGVYGVDELTAFSQGQTVMFLVGAFGLGLITTGMVFARTWYGYLSYRRLNTLMVTTLIAIEVVASLPPFGDWIFEGFFALPPELAAVGRKTLLFGAVMNGTFFLRNLPVVLLLNRFRSGWVGFATVVRILATLAMAVVFPRLGWTGAAWGVGALTIGVVLEYFICWIAAVPYRRDLMATSVEAGELSFRDLGSLTWEQFRFTLPLAIGGVLLSTSPLIVAWYLGRSANPDDMLAIHYLTLGVANPVALAALRMQTVAIKFMPEYPGDRRLLVYSVAAGLVLGLVPFVFSLSFPGDWYFAEYQNIRPRILGTAKLAVGIYSLICVIQAVRGRVEGIAAALKRTDAVMDGQIAYVVALFLTCTVMFWLHCDGWKIAITAIYVAPVCTIGMVYGALRLKKR